MSEARVFHRPSAVSRARRAQAKRYTPADVLAAFKPGEWLSVAQIAARLGVSAWTTSLTKTLPGLSRAGSLRRKVERVPGLCERRVYYALSEEQAHEHGRTEGD